MRQQCLAHAERYKRYLDEPVANRRFSRFVASPQELVFARAMHLVKIAADEELFDNPTVGGEPVQIVYKRAAMLLALLLDDPLMASADKETVLRVRNRVEAHVAALESEQMKRE